MLGIGKGTRRAIAFGLAASLAMAVSACGGSKSSGGMSGGAVADPVAQALQAPGVRTVVVPKQRGDLTIVVPPCNATQVDQESTDIPPGSNQILVPKDTLAQTIAIQPCVEGQKQTGQGTILMTPGGAGQSQQQQTQQGQSQQQNQLIVPDNSDLERVIVPACQVIISSSSSSSPRGAGTATNSRALPSSGGQRAGTAPPCEVCASSSNSSNTSGES